MEKAIFLIGIAIQVCAFAVASAQTATFYTPPYVPSACYEYQDMGIMIAAASTAIWDNKGACGRRYRVTCTGATNGVPMPCTGNSIVVMITDLCPDPGCNGTIDLSQEAFAMIADPNAGKVYIDLVQV